jgi:hypothetical protein
MAATRISGLFNGKFFEIPKYQRGCAQDRQNIRDLFDDIIESIESSSNHCIGTIVLSRDNNDKYYKEQFQVSLNSNIFGNRALNFIFLNYCKNIAGKDFTINELKKMKIPRRRAAGYLRPGRKSPAGFSHFARGSPANRRSGPWVSDPPSNNNAMVTKQVG